MTVDRDTFLVALYTTVDDLYQEHFAPLKPKRPGKRPELSDSEVVTLALSAQWFGRSERAFLRYASAHWREDYTACVLTPKNYGDASSKQQHAGWKQVVETSNGQLEDAFGLHFPGAHSKRGLLCRVAAKLAALNLGIWLNQYLGRPNLALGTLING